jgi:hypothetical protein
VKLVKTCLIKSGPRACRDAEAAQLQHCDGWLEKAHCKAGITHFNGHGAAAYWSKCVLEGVNLVQPGSGAISRSCCVVPPYLVQQETVRADTNIANRRAF